MSENKLTEDNIAEELEKRFEVERYEYNEKIQELINLTRNISRIPEAQALMLSYRHIFVDKIPKLKLFIYKRKSKDDIFKQQRYTHYLNNIDRRLENKELVQYVNADMSNRNRIVLILEAQVEYYLECISTLDKMGFSIKNIISAEELKLKISG